MFIGPTRTSNNRTLKEECFSLAYRQKFYASLEALQADLDEFVQFYNE